MFRRGDAVSEGDKRIYQAQLKISGRVEFKTILIETRDRVDAIAKAKTTYLSLSQLVKDGGSIDNNKLFDKAWRDWYDTMVSP